MSHIVKGRVSVAYKDKELLVRALQSVGLVYEKEKLFRVGYGLTSERYDLVVVDRSDLERRIGFNKEGDIWNQYQEDFGKYGDWTRQTSSRIQDAYIAFHYQRQLETEGYDVKVTQMPDGSLNLYAEEHSF